MKNLLIIIFCSFSLLYGCSGSENKKEAKEAESEMNKMDDAVDHGKISSKCGGHLDEFEKLLAEYAGLTKTYLETKQMDETYKNDLEGRLRTKMEELSKNSEIFMDTDCTLAFTNAQQKFQTYVMEMAQAQMGE